ncbi:MAG: NUDIX hydrolase [Cyanobacteria bacterium REEB498]|nr:NUDIX hydrolase [Cyanobacteria bacterium REEB498]
MPATVALAILERDGRWLMQLRDDVPGIVGPGCWGLFGGHLEPGETPEQALRRELLEEIGWGGGALEFRFLHQHPRRLAHVFMGPLTVPLQRLRLLEGQDMALVGATELRSGAIHSPKLGQTRPLVDGVAEILERLLPPDRG